METVQIDGKCNAAIRSLTPLFMVSGATSLVYETVWARQLHLVFGTSQLAICTLLAAFMAGLALGGLIAARWSSRIRKPVLAYAALEAFIGVYALAFPLLLGLVEPLYLGFWRALEPGPLAFGMFQFLLMGCMLMPATLCMGATLPLLAGFANSHDAQTGRHVGRLYGANTLGAVIGVAVAGFFLLPKFGLSATTWIAALGNFALAAAAVKLNKTIQRGVDPQIIHDRDEKLAHNTLAKTPAFTRMQIALLVMAGLAGACSLAYEVAWFRLMVLILGGSAYAFSIMLLAFLLGIGIGGWAGGAWADRMQARGGIASVLKTLACLQVGIALIAWISMFAYGELPFTFVWLFNQLENSPGLFWPGQLLLALGVMLPAALLMGAAFPFLVRAAAGGQNSIARPVGHIYAANTLGAVVGAFVGGFFMLPALNMQGTILTAASFNIAAGLLAWILQASFSQKRKAERETRNAGSALRFPVSALSGLIALALIALINLARPDWDPRIMTSGMYQEVMRLTDRTREGLLQRAAVVSELLFYDEGLSSVVTVGRERDTGNIWLANNGKVDASSRGDLPTQVLLAHLPFLFKPDAREVLVIGFASGISAGCVALHDSPQRIDIVEIEPAVIQASHFFDEFNHRPLEDPRVRLHLNDGRNHVKLTPDATYDMVVSEPPNPWITGVSNLFTREFFELGRRTLRTGGVWSQWLQTYSMGTDDVRSVMATFASVYRHVLLFKVGDADLVLIGSDAPLPLDVQAMARAAGTNQRVIDSLHSVRVDKVEQLLAMFVIDQSGIRMLTGGWPLNTDDNMLVEYSAPLYLCKDTGPDNDRLLTGAADIPYAAIASPESLAALAGAYFNQHDTTRGLLAFQTARANFPDNPSVQKLVESVEETLPKFVKAPEQ